MKTLVNRFEWLKELIGESNSHDLRRAFAVQMQINEDLSKRIAKLERAQAETEASIINKDPEYT